MSNYGRFFLLLVAVFLLLASPALTQRHQHGNGRTNRGAALVRLEDRRASDGGGRSRELSRPAVPQGRSHASEIDPMRPIRVRRVLAALPVLAAGIVGLAGERSEERRVGEEGRSRGSPYH